MIDSVIEKPIDKIRYPSCTKKARHYLVLAQIAIVVWFVLFAVLQYIAVRYFDGWPRIPILLLVVLPAFITIACLYNAANDNSKCCHCNSPVMIHRFNWLGIASGLLPVCKRCRAIVGAEFIKPLPDNPANPVNPDNETPTERTQPMKPFARINLSSAALHRGRGKCCQCENIQCQ